MYHWNGSAQVKAQESAVCSFWLCHFGIRLVPFWHKIDLKTDGFGLYLVPFWHKRMPLYPPGLMPIWHSILYIAISRRFMAAVLASSQVKTRTHLRCVSSDHSGNAKSPHFQVPAHSEPVCGSVFRTVQQFCGEIQSADCLLIQWPSPGSKILRLPIAM